MDRSAFASTAKIEIVVVEIEIDCSIEERGNTPTKAPKRSGVRRLQHSVPRVAANDILFIGTTLWWRSKVAAMQLYVPNVVNGMCWQRN